MPDAVLLRITHGEAVALFNGLRAAQCDELPTGANAFEILNAASTGLGNAVKALVYEVQLYPWSELKWKLTSTPEGLYRPTFERGHWFCLPWA